MLGCIVNYLNMPCHHIWLHCTDAMYCLLFIFFFRCYFNSPIDHKLGSDRQYVDYTAVPYSYPAGQGKYSPLISNPSFQSILILIYVLDSNASFAIELPIVALSVCCLTPYPPLLAWLGSAYMCVARALSICICLALL